MNADKIRGKIAERKYTKQMFAKALDMAPSTLTRKLSGEGEFTVGEAEKMCDLLGITNPIEKAEIFLT